MCGCCDTYCSVGGLFVNLESYVVNLLQDVAELTLDIDSSDDLSFRQIYEVENLPSLSTLYVLMLGQGLLRSRDDHPFSGDSLELVYYSRVQSAYHWNKLE